MKLAVEKDALLEALQKVQSIVGQRSTLPILSNVLLKAESGTISLTTTDMEVCVKTTATADVSEEGGTTLPARRFFSICRELPGGQVEIEVDAKDVATIRCGPAFFKLVGLPEEDFPPLPEFEESEVYTVEQDTFKEMLQKVIYAASTDETRYILNGALLSFKDEKLTVVATDGRRLALVEQEVEFPEDAQAGLVVPTKTLNELVKTLGGDGALKIRVSQTQVAFDFDRILVISKLIEGTYPNFQQVIPSQCEERVAIDRETMLTAVRRVSLLTDDQTASIRLNFGRNKLELVTNSPEIGEARETIPVKYEGKEISIAFNPGFLMAPLRNLDSDEIFFELSDELSPGVIKTSVPFLYVLMPIRVS
ncbi:MAG: DNA polymerase III subunit beta [Kiritimatiellales bacterium]